jgi:DNA-binding CsgD family transcriptional regulator
MTSALTDDDLRRLRRSGGAAACNDQKILTMLREIVERCPDEKIHWLLGDGRDEILAGWLERRLIAPGRLAAMIDKANGVRALRALAAKDLQQYADEQRRSELPRRLFRRVDKLLRANPQRFQVMILSDKPGSTYWTLAGRPASAIFSEREQELRAHVFGLALNTLTETPGAGKQTQFLSAAELERYAFGMLERTARGLSLDQLLLGLVQTFGLKPSFQELPEEDLLNDHPFESERQGIETHDPPEFPGNDATLPAARALIDSLTARQTDVLRCIYAEPDNQREIATQLGCSQATISTEKNAIGIALNACAAPDEQVEVLATTIRHLNGTPQ